MKDKTRHNGLRRSARTRAITLACQTGLVAMLLPLAAGLSAQTPVQQPNQHGIDQKFCRQPWGKGQHPPTDNG